jgi:protein-L-isoaspartate(D-aspartate) O-methyltransferase
MFLPLGPWFIAMPAGRCIKTPSADPVYVYQDVLVAIDKDREINNGQPSFHARIMRWLAPEPGQTIVHIGAGTGYYSAILAMLGRAGALLLHRDLVDGGFLAGAAQLRNACRVSLSIGKKLSIRNS